MGRAFFGGPSLSTAKQIKGRYGHCALWPRALGSPPVRVRAFSEDNTMREKGIIKRFFPERGFGFITRDGKPDVFFHCHQVGTEDEETITAGKLVEFEVTEKDGRYRAVDVVLL